MKCDKCGQEVPLDNDAVLVDLIFDGNHIDTKRLVARHLHYSIFYRSSTLFSSIYMNTYYMCDTTDSSL